MAQQEQEVSGNGLMAVEAGGMNELSRVISRTIDGDDEGHEWFINYVVYEIEGQIELWEDDGEGNGTQIAVFGTARRARNTINARRCAEALACEEG